MKAKKYIAKEVDIDIQGITLLSTEEYLKYEKNIPYFNQEYWLRSPGIRRPYVAYVCNFGYLHLNMGAANYSYLEVRPALKSSELTIRDKFRLFDYNWTAISDKYLLCDISIGRHCFRYDNNADDVNNYETSDVKKFVENWFKEKVDNDE